MFTNESKFKTIFIIIIINKVLSVYWFLFEMYCSSFLRRPMKQNKYLYIQVTKNKKQSWPVIGMFNLQYVLSGIDRHYPVH